MRYPNSRAWQAAITAVAFLGLASLAQAGHGWGHKAAACGTCGDYDAVAAHGDHGLNSYIHGHRIVRTWGGPKRPLPVLSGTPGFWDQPGWFADPYFSTAPWPTAPTAAAGQTLGGK